MLLQAQWLVQLQALLLELPWPACEASWADEFFYGECLQGIWVEGELLGKFQSRETGTNAAFNQLPSGSSLDPVFNGISAVHGKVAAPPTPGIPQISSRRQLMGLAGLAEDPGSGVTHFGIFRPSELQGEVRLLYNGFAVVTAANPSLSSTTPDAHECVDARSRDMDEWQRGPQAGTRLELSFEWTLRAKSRAGGRTKRWARVREGLTRLNWERVEETRVSRKRRGFKV